MSNKKGGKVQISAPRASGSTSSKCMRTEDQKEQEKRDFKDLEKSLEEFKILLDEKMNSKIQNKSDIVARISEKNSKVNRFVYSNRIKEYQDILEMRAKLEEESDRSESIKPQPFQKTIAKLDDEIEERVAVVAYNNITSEDELLLISKGGVDLDQFPEYKQRMEKIDTYIGEINAKLSEKNSVCEQESRIREFNKHKKVMCYDPATLDMIIRKEMEADNTANEDDIRRRYMRGAEASEVAFNRDTMQYEFS